jgi:hypothetical protein
MIVWFVSKELRGMWKDATAMAYCRPIDVRLEELMTSQHFQ